MQGANLERTVQVACLAALMAVVPGALAKAQVEETVDAPTSETLTPYQAIDQERSPTRETRAKNQPNLLRPVKGKIGICADGPSNPAYADNCDTPRSGTLSGAYSGIGLGLSFLTEEAMQDNQIGPGGSGRIYLGVAFWDHLLTEFHFGGYSANDRAPFTESVMSCYMTTNVCSAPVETESSVSAEFIGIDVGVQQRIRPFAGLSIALGAMLGGSLALGNFTRSISCEGCSEQQQLDASPAGFHAAGLLRLTFGQGGHYGAVARSQWALSGDVASTHSIAIEFGLP